MSEPDNALLLAAPRLVDLVPYTSLADGLPTPVSQPVERLWVKHEDAADSRYGGNKVRKLEHLLAVAARRGGPVLTAGAVGSHHVVATAVHAARLGLDVEAVRFPQPETDHVRAMSARADDLGVRTTVARSSYLMPAVLAARWAALAPGGATLVTPGGSTPLGTLGHVATGLELAAQVDEEPDDVIVALGSGGTAVGIALGLAMAGWRRARVVAVRVADRIVTNRPVLAGIEAGVRGLLGLAGVRPSPVRLTIDGGWFGAGYGHPTAAGAEAQLRAAELGLTVEPTYTAKALAAALARHEHGRRVVYVHTLSQ